MLKKHIEYWVLGASSLPISDIDWWGTRYLWLLLFPGASREKKTIPLQGEHLIYVKRENVSTICFISCPLWHPLTKFINILAWKNVFPFVLVFRSLQTEWERFPSISSLGWSVGKQYLQSKYLSRLNQSRKTGHTWAVFNGCWVNIISYIGCSKELEITGNTCRGYSEV